MDRLMRGEKRYFNALGLFNKQIKEIVDRYPLLGNKIICEAVGQSRSKCLSNRKLFNKRVAEVKKIILKDSF